MISLWLLHDMESSRRFNFVLKLSLEKENNRIRETLKTLLPEFVIDEVSQNLFKVVLYYRLLVFFIKTFNITRNVIVLVESLHTIVVMLAYLTYPFLIVFQ